VYAAYAYGTHNNLKYDAFINYSNDVYSAYAYGTHNNLKYDAFINNK
jgi:hypothetical protein